jgi:hypothetical protein
MRLRGVIVVFGACCALLGGSAIAPAVAEPASADDLVQKLEAIPGMTVVGERPTEPGFQFFDLTYTQPADHRRPRNQKFEQRLTLLHRDESRPVVAYTSGYYVPDAPARSEPTQLLDANQVSIEYRFFEPSRPEPADWVHDLDIWQAATDEHRIIEALKGIYAQNWITTGGSKGGMTATYHRRFYPNDVDGTVAYVAPNDVDNDEDKAYDELFARVATPECRDAMSVVQREVLLRRDEMLAKFGEFAQQNKLTFDRMSGGMDQALEGTVLDTSFGFWQYRGVAECPEIPAANAPTDEIFQFVQDTVGWDAYADQGLDHYLPYYYQAATELGWPTVSHRHLDDLLRHDNDQGPVAYIPEDVPVAKFRESSMRDVDHWVRTQGSQLMFVNGEGDPWAAEPFRLGEGSEDSEVHVVPDGTHGSKIAMLPAQERDAAIATVRRWGGIGGDPALTQAPLRVPALDDQPMERHPL